MKKELINLIRFTEKSKGLETKDKIKLILFLEQVKPNTEVLLKVGPKNLGEKYEFEKRLKENKTLFLVSQPKSYEEIKKIKGNKVFWEIKGTYYSYDLFKNTKHKENFQKYINLLEKGKYTEGDKIAGNHYGYPKCCNEQFIKEKSANYLKKKYTYWEYYKKLKNMDHKFPFLSHLPHSLECTESINMNKLYEQTIKKTSKKIYKEYSSKGKYKGNLIMGDISDVEIKGKSIWPKKAGYEYELIYKKPFRRHYYLVSFLSKKKYQKGQVLKGVVTLQYDYATVEVTKEKNKVIKNLHHERQLPLLGEVTIG